MLGAGGFGVLFAIAKPEQEIHGHHERGAGVGGGSDFLHSQGIGAQEKHGRPKIFHRRMGRGDGGVQIVVQFALGGVGPAERLGQDKSAGSAGADDDDTRPGRFGGERRQGQRHDQQRKKPDEFSAKFFHRSQAYRTFSNAKPFRYSVSGIMGMMG